MGPNMDDLNSTVSELAVELMDVAEELIDCGECHEDVQAAFIAVAIRLRELQVDATIDARKMLARTMAGG